MKTKTNKKTEKKRRKNDHILEEWKYLNEYVTKMELDHTAKIAMLITGIIICLATLFSEKNCLHLGASYVFATVPIAVVGILAYTVHQFYNISIIRGYMNYLEEKINDELGYVHLWNMGLYKANKFGRTIMPAVVFIALIFLEIFCVFLSGFALKMWNYGFKVAYWEIIIVIVIALFLIFCVDVKDLDERTYNHLKKISEINFKKIDYYNFIKKSRKKNNKDISKYVYMFFIIIFLAVNILIAAFVPIYLG